MSDGLARAERKIESHQRFQRDGSVFVYTESPFSATLSVSKGDDNALKYRLEVSLPSLDAVVTDQPVPSVVLDGWADTLERRLREAHQASSEIESATYEFDRTQDAVNMTVTVSHPDESEPLDGLAAIVQFAEGTYLQGVIPGYEYGPPVDGMLEQARTRGEQA